MKSSKRTLVLSLVAVAAIVVVGSFYFNYPPVDGRNAQGTIGAVKKHQQTQITPADVVLGDESLRKSEAMFYGNALQDANQLASFSYNMSALASKLRNGELAQKQVANLSAEMASQTQAIESRSKTLAQRALAMTDAMLANRELSQFQAELQSMRQNLAAASSLDAAAMANLASTLENAEQTLAQKLKMQEQALANAEAALQNFEQSLASREELNAAHLENMQAELGRATAALQATTNENRSVSAGIRQLEAQMLEQKSLIAAREHLQSAAAQLQNGDFASLASHAEQLNAVSNTLASEAAALENHALANMKARLAASNGEAEQLAQMESALASISKNLAGRAKLGVASLESFEQALANFEQQLQNIEASLAQRFLAHSQSELAAVNSFIENRSKLANQGFDAAQMQNAALAAMSLQNSEALAMASSLEGRKLNSRAMTANRNILASYAEYLSSVSDAMENRKLANQDLEAQLNVQASQLENAAASLESKAAR